MYKYIGFLLLCITRLSSSAQISLIQYPLPTTQMKASDMFRADVLNTDNQTRQMYFVGTVTNTHNGQKVVTAKTQLIDVPPGAKQLNESLLQPAYLFGSASAEQSGSLPYGNYEVCLDAFIVGTIEPTANACSEVELMPLSPPLLINPEHESTVQEEYPLLVWLPPMPIGKDKVLYDLKLVEMLPNQTAYDAIQRNFAVLEKQNITGTTLQYPANAMKLETGKRYAWRVNALTATRKPVGETEVWWFTKGAATTSQPEEPVADRYYIILDDESDKKSVVVKEQLKIVSQDYVNTTDLQYTITNQDGTEISKEEVELTAEGSGRFVFLFTNPRRHAGQHLKLVVTTPKGRKKFIAFTFIKS